MAITTTATLDRYNYAIGGNWNKAAEDPKIKAFNEILRQEAFERQRIRIQGEMKLQGYKKKPGKKVEKSEEIARLCKEYPYNSRVHYKLRNGRTVIRRIVSVWHEDEAGRAVCNAALSNKSRTVILATRVIRRIINDDRKVSNV